MADVTKKAVFKGIAVEHVRSPRTLYNPARKAVFKSITVERLLELKKKDDFTLFFGTV